VREDRKDALLLIKAVAWKKKGKKTPVIHNRIGECETILVLGAAQR
jgi:hypothetical protein